MGFSSLHVCMESSSDHWLQGTIHEESAAMDSSSPSSGDMNNNIGCSSTRPITTEKRLRPPQDQLALKCPRCESTHTKFCYYNNYSLSQPRYFCKSCRRYWTKGGTLRNIPVGGGCRKNKKVSSNKKSSNNNDNNNQSPIVTNNNQIQAPPFGGGPSYPSNNFPDLLQFPHYHISNLLIGSGTNAGALMENHNFMESKYNMLEGMIRSSRNNLDLFGINSVGDNHVNDYYNSNSNSNSNVLASSSPNNSNYLQGFCTSSSSAFGGMSLVDGNNIMESCHQRLMLPYYGSSSSCGDEQNSLVDDVKPNTRVLSLEWQDLQQGPSDGKDIFRCIDGPGSWNGVMINGYGSSTTNPLV